MFIPPRYILSQILTIFRRKKGKKIDICTYEMFYVMGVLVGYCGIVVYVVFSGEGWISVISAEIVRANRLRLTLSRYRIEGETSLAHFPLGLVPQNNCIIV